MQLVLSLADEGDTMQSLCSDLCTGCQSELGLSTRFPPCAIVAEIHLLLLTSLIFSQSINLPVLCVLQTLVSWPFQDINVPNYCISRKDSVVIGETGIAVYIHNSVADITHRRQDLESDLVECIWLELKSSTNAPNIIIFIFVQKPFCFLWMVWQLCTNDR